MTLRRAGRAVTRRGFTLLEVLVVVAIIVVLAGVGVVALMPQFEGAKEKLAKAKALDLTQAVQIYKVNNDDYPPSLDALAQQQPNGGPPLVQPDALRDPWGQPFGYNPQGPNNGGLKPDIWATRP